MQDEFAPMKFLFDFLPFLVFVGFYLKYDFYIATAALIAASVVQLSFYWIVFRKVEKMLVISVLLVVVFGASTLILHDEDILKWKTSVFYFLSEAVFLASHFIGKKV